MLDYSAYVERSGLHEVLDNVLRKYTADSWNPVTRAAACHFYTAIELPVSHRKTVVEDNPDIRSMLDTFRNGGNCVDKAVFLASLLSHVDNVETRFTEVERAPEGHVLLETCFPGFERSEIEEQLINFHRRNHDFGSYQFAWEKNRRNKSPWFIADPGLSRYIGDVKALKEKGLAETEDSGWGWNYPTQTHPV